MQFSNHRVWYAAYTHSRAEKKVAQKFEDAGIEHYLPLITTLRQWSDRKKRVTVPLIRSYVFVHITPKQHMRVVETFGVVKIVHFCGLPVPIPEWQIRNLKILLGYSLPMEQSEYDFTRGEEVHIVHGPLRGLRGKITQIRGQHKLVISIHALNFNLTIDIDPRFVEMIA